MNDLLTTVVLSLFASAHPALLDKSAKATLSSEKVVVLEQVPTTGAYRWQVQPSHIVSCVSKDCDAYYMPSPESAANGDVVLRLQMADGRVLIAECDAKELPVVGYAMKLYDGLDANVPKRRGCRAPKSGEETASVIEGNRVKLLLAETKQDGSAATFSETYFVKGYLIPAGEEKTVATARKCLVTSSPYGAQVYLDGEKVGIAPMTLTLPSDGAAHQLAVKKDGFATGERSVAAESDEKRFSFNLQPER